MIRTRAGGGFCSSHDCGGIPSAARQGMRRTSYRWALHAAQRQPETLLSGASSMRGYPAWSARQLAAMWNLQRETTEFASTARILYLLLPSLRTHDSDLTGRIGESAGALHAPTGADSQRTAGTAATL